jgi:hypothetical protein
MERTTNVDPEAIKWKKIGGGSFHATINGRQVIIKPGQVFFAKEEEIPSGVRDLVVPVDPVGVQKKVVEQEAKVAEAIKPVYNLQHRGGGWFDIVDADGKVQNEKALKKEDAEMELKLLTK